MAKLGSTSHPIFPQPLQTTKILLLELPDTTHEAYQISIAFTRAYAFQII